MPPTYTLWKNGKFCGPFQEQQLRSMQKHGIINGSDSVWTEGMADWTMISALLPDLPALSSHASAPAPASSLVEVPSNAGTEPKKQAARMGRLSYLVFYLLSFATMVVVDVIMIYAGQPLIYVNGANLLIHLLVMAIPTVLRLRDTGSTVWGVILLALPLAGTLVAVYCLSAPSVEVKKQTKQLFISILLAMLSLSFVIAVTLATTKIINHFANDYLRS